MRSFSNVFADTAAAAAVAVVAVAAPASAARNGGARATSSLQGGDLDLTLSASARLGTTDADGTLSANVLAVSPNDQRAALRGFWTAEANDSAFLAGHGTLGGTVAATDGSYPANGPVAASPGTVSYHGGPVSVGTAAATAPASGQNRRAVTSSTPRSAS